MSLKRTLLDLGQLVRMRPYVENAALGIHCAICRKPVEYEEIVEARPDASAVVKILVRCHGAEDLQVLDLGTIHWTDQDFRSMKNRLVVFKPDQGERPQVGYREPAPIQPDGVGDRCGRNVTQDAPAPSSVVLASERWGEGEKAG